MRQEHLELLCCPLSLEPLSLEVDERADDGHVVTGALRSSRARYPIDAGVPRFILSEHSHDESTTVEAFGKQWDDAGGFSWTYGQDEDYFEQYFHPLPPASFRDRSVLDAGCGNGRLVEFALRYQPGVVVGLDYSRSVDIAFRRTRTAPNVLIVQGSLLALPLAHQQFHVIFSLGVIHHLSSPAEGVERSPSFSNGTARCTCGLTVERGTSSISRSLDRSEGSLGSRLRRLSGCSASFVPFSAGRTCACARSCFGSFRPSSFFPWTPTWRFSILSDSRCSRW